MTHAAHYHKRLKAAFRNLLADCGGAEMAASHVRVGPTAIYNYGNVNIDEAYPPADVIAELEAQCQQPHVSRVICEATGYVPVLFHLPQQMDELSIALARVAKENSDIFAKAAEAMRDGELSPQEADTVLKEVDDAVRVLLSLKTHLEGLASEKSDAFSASFNENRGGE